MTKKFEVGSYAPSAMSHVKDIFKIVPTEKGSDEQ